MGNPEVTKTEKKVERRSMWFGSSNKKKEGAIARGKDDCKETERNRATFSGPTRTGPPKIQRTRLGRTVGNEGIDTISQLLGSGAIRAAMNHPAPGEHVTFV